MEKKTSKYYCNSCKKVIGDVNTVICSCCLKWIHWKCDVLKDVPKAIDYICKMCLCNK